MCRSSLAALPLRSLKGLCEEGSGEEWEVCFEGVVQRLSSGVSSGCPAGVQQCRGVSSGVSGVREGEWSGGLMAEPLSSEARQQKGSAF